MRKIITLIGCLLLSTALMAQNTGQLYNDGKLYVSPQTLMTAESDFINDTAGHYNNDGEVLLRGSFRNDGQAGFKKKGGLTRFEGYGIQEISGVKAAKYYNILFKNNHDQYPFHLSGKMIVFGMADLVRGILENKTFGGTIIFKDGATHQDVSDQSYVEGAIIKEGDGAFVYPIGKKGYFRPAATLLESGQQMELSGEYLWKNSDSQYDHQEKETNIAFIDDQEYWQIDNNQHISDSVYVRLSWRDVTTSQEILDAAEKGSHDYRVVVVHWNPDKQIWVNVGGTTEQSKKTVTSDLVGDYGVFALGLIRDWDVCKKVINITIQADKQSDENHLSVTYDGDCSDIYETSLYEKWGAVISNQDNYGDHGLPETADFITDQGQNGEDTDGDGDIDRVEIPNIGTWTVHDNGQVTYASDILFPSDPQSMRYTVSDQMGNIRDSVFINIRYVYDAPVANDDESKDNLPDIPVSLSVLDNDESASQEGLAPTSIDLIGSAGSICMEKDRVGKCKVLSVPDEGKWKANQQGDIIFTPNKDFHGSPTPIHYTVEDKNGQKSNEASVTIGVIEGHDFFIPSGFTPNNDGHNDVWKVYGSTIQKVYIMVYNQYGQRMFDSRDVNVGWDGRFKGKLQPTGVYVYYARITFYDGAEVTKKGSITLIR